MNEPKLSAEFLPRQASIKPTRNGTERSSAPVFVVGCHRSGTNLLYDMLLSAGGFAIYRGLLPVYQKLIPRFGNFANWSNRKRMMETWVRSQGFRRSGLDRVQLERKILQECRTGGDFIQIVMGEIAREQNVSRWAVYNPDNLLHMMKIKADIPDALFIHIIRDGRDIALSLRKMGFRPFPWRSASRSLSATALYWEWMVRKGQDCGRKIPRDYIEIHYEELVCNPEQTLNRLGSFLAHRLDYDVIRQHSLGRLRESNSSYLEEQKNGILNPVNRWKERLTAQQVAELEYLVGDTLKQLAYPLSVERATRTCVGDGLMGAIYPVLFGAKLWLKVNTAFGRFASLAELELSDRSVAPSESPKDIES